MQRGVPVGQPGPNLLLFLSDWTLFFRRGFLLLDLGVITPMIIGGRRIMEPLGDPQLTCHSGTRTSYLSHCMEGIYRHRISLEIVNRNHQ